MPKSKTYNPRLARPEHANRFRGVTAALVKTAIPKELSSTSSNAVSTEVRQLKAREGTRRLETFVEAQEFGDQEVFPTIYDGSIHERYYGLEASGLAEGTRIWANKLFPFASGPASNITFTPQFPTFLPPSFPDAPNWGDYGVEVPDITGIDFPPITGIPNRPPAPVPLYPETPPNQPYGPDEPPGHFPPSTPPETPCGWKVGERTQKFRLFVQITKWKIVSKQDNPVIIAPCVENFCAPARVDCANFAEAQVAAKAWGEAFLEAAKEGPSWFAAGYRQKEIETTSGSCASIVWDDHESVNTNTTEEFTGLCNVPEFPTGTPLSPIGFKITKDPRNVHVFVDITILDYRPLQLASSLCRRISLELTWENGHKRRVPMNNSATKELDGDDLKITNFDLGEINALKSAVDYPTYTPCDLESPNYANVVCTIPAAFWDCAGKPPPIPGFV